MEHTYHDHLVNEIEIASKAIEDYIVYTPLDIAITNEDTVLPSHVKVFFKCEFMQHTGSFKLRGAINKLLRTSAKEKERGIIAASTGNHGMAVCYSAQLLGGKAVIYTPTTVVETKVKGILALGGELIKHGKDSGEAESYARKVAEEQQRVFISPYNDAEVIAGQGTLGVEILKQFHHYFSLQREKKGGQALDAVYVSVGGGGLIGGIGLYIKKHSPSTKIVGVWPENSPVMYECMKAKKIIDVDEKPTISDGTAGGIEDNSITLPICEKVIDEYVLVKEEEIKNAMRLLASYQHYLVEGSAALAYAGLIKHYQEKGNSRTDNGAIKQENVVVVLCGRNVSIDKFSAAIKSS